MIHLNKILDLAPQVNYTALQKYLLSRGWNKINTKREDAAVMISPNNNSKFDILLPLTRAFDDYNELIISSVKKIAQYESRDEFQIMNDLIAPPADIVRYRIDNEFTTYGAIPLKSGFDLLESAKKSLLTAASDLVNPTLYHKRMSYKSVVQFIDSCFLGQTERGSYIASIICPFVSAQENNDKPKQLTLFTPDDELLGSFTRKVTQRLMTSLQRVKKIVESGDTHELENSSQEYPISANFLESLVEINEFAQNSKIEISTTWAPTISIPKDVPSTIEITSDYIEPIKSIIDKISPEVIEELGEYVGRISKISANPDAKNREDGEITFNFIGEDQKAVSAKVILRGSELHDAMQAFDSGKNIRIKGNLKVQSRQRIIESPEFKVID